MVHCVVPVDPPGVHTKTRNSHTHITHTRHTHVTHTRGVSGGSVSQTVSHLTAQGRAHMVYATEGHDTLYPLIFLKLHLDIVDLGIDGCELILGG